MGSAIDIARYLVWLADHESESDCLTPLRLQKLLYYAQGYALATFGQPLFQARIEAWKDGPVVREVWQQYQGRLAIPPNEGVVPLSLSVRDREFVKAVWEAHKGFSAIRLRDMTHQEAPWVEARGDLPEGAHGSTEITAGSLLRYFGPRVKEKLIPGFSPEAAYTGVEQLAAGMVSPHSEVFARLRNRAHGV